MTAETRSYIFRWRSRCRRRRVCVNSLIPFHYLRQYAGSHEGRSRWQTTYSYDNRRIFVYTFCLINICLSLSDDSNKIKTLNIERTVLVFSENLSPIHRKVSEKFSSKNSKFYRGCMAHYLFCHPAIAQFLMAVISFNTACKALKIAQIAQLNQVFQLLH